LVVLVVPVTLVSPLPSSTVATAALSETSLTFSRKPTRRSRLSWRALLVRAAASVEAEDVVVVAVAAEVLPPVTSEASTVAVEEVRAALVAATGEELPTEVPVASVEDQDTAAPLLVATAEDTAAEAGWVAEATVTRPVPAASLPGDRLLYQHTKARA